MLVGGLILAAGLAVVEAARISFSVTSDRGLALTVVATVLAITFVPAAMAILGRLLLRSDRRRHPDRPIPTTQPGRLSRLLARRPAAASIVVLVIAVLGAGSWQLRYMQVGFTDVTGLPSSAPQRTGYDALVRGFAPGMLAPTQVVVWGRGVALQHRALNRLQSQLDVQPGVAAVIGPADDVPDANLGLLTGRHNGAARYIVVLGRDPFGAPAVRSMRQLSAALSEHGAPGRHSPRPHRYNGRYSPHGKRRPRPCARTSCGSL